jgi:hypothetical protein
LIREHPAVNDAPKRKNMLRRFLGGALTVLAALWIFLEEWLWDAMLAFMAFLGRLPPVRWVETQISKLPPYAALVAFLIPAAVLLPFKLAAFWLIAHGHGLYGLWVFVIAKIIGTAFLARIFALTKSALLTIAWFARAYHAISAWKDRLYAYVKALPAYRRIGLWTRALKRRLKRWFRGRIA